MALSVDIRKKLGDFQLKVQLEAGEPHLALLGASGCGKSVTLQCIAGILNPDEGRISLNGRLLFDSAAHINLPPQQRKIGYLFQSYALFPHMTVRQNIAIAARESGMVVDLLGRFQLEEAADLRPCQLSGGQQQRTALARILASQPEAILLDEPFSALDSFLKYQLELELAETLDGFAGTVLWVSHDRGEVFRNCESVCVLDRGKSQGVTSREGLFRRPGTLAAARLSGCKNTLVAQADGCYVTLPAWHISLHCGETVPPDTAWVGIRSHHVHLAEPGAENAVSCDVTRVIEDVFGSIVLLRPQGAEPNAPLLRMELGKEVWQGVAQRAQVTVAVAPTDILLLK